AASLTFLSGEVRRDTVAGRPVVGAVVRSLPEALATAPFAAVTDEEGRFVVAIADESASGSLIEGAVVASRLDVSDPLFARVIRRDVRGVVGPPAPPGTRIAQLEVPFVLPSTLPAAVIDVLGDVVPPTVEIQLAGSSFGQGYAALGDALTITVVTADDDEVTFVGLEIDDGAGLEAVALSPDGSYALVPFAPGVIELRARAQDRTGNTTFVERTLQVVPADANGLALPPTSAPGRPPSVLLPTESADPAPGEEPPTPVIPDANEISFDGEIVVLFSEPLDPATVNEDTVEVLDPELVPIPINVTTEFGDSAIRITPKRNMRLGARYEARLGSAIQDLDGESFGGTTLEWECPGPEQIATVDLPNATDVALLDAIETTDPKTGEEQLLEDVLVAVNFPLGSEEPGAIHTYQVRDAEDPDLLLDNPILLGSTATNGNPWSVAVDGDRAYVGNAWKGPIVLRDGTISYAKEVVGSILGQSQEVLRANTGYQWSDGLPNPASNFEVIDLSDPSKPTRVGTKLANFGRLFSQLTAEPLWDPNVLPTRVEVTDQGIAMLNHLENIEFFEPADPFDSTGVLENVWGPGTRPGRCEAGPEEGQMCPANYSPPFWPCLGGNECVPTDEFYDAAYFDATESHGAFAVVLQRDQQGAGARLIATDNLGDPLTFDNTLSTLPIPTAARSQFGRVGAVQEFEWEDEDGAIRVADLAFIATPGDRTLRIFDVTSPSAPVELTTMATRLTDTFGNMSFDECVGVAYLKGVDGEFHIVDFNDPRQPLELNDPGERAAPFRVQGVGATVSFNGNTNNANAVFLAEEAGVAVVNARLCSSYIENGTMISSRAMAAAVPSTRVVRGTPRLCVNEGKKACVKIDLDIRRSDGRVLAEALDDKQGGFVAINNDDDDYDGLSDHVDHNGVKGESDLVKLELAPVKPRKRRGEYTLEFSSQKINVWKQRNRRGPVPSGTKFNASKGATLFVEGLELSDKLADEEILLTWNGKLKGKPVVHTDMVKFTVYQIEGPDLGVPNYSTHRYVATLPHSGVASDPTTGSWTAIHGTLKSVQRLLLAIPGAGQETLLAEIHWDAPEAVVGSANFTPVPGFTNRREVNVVKIELGFGAKNFVRFQNPPSANFGPTTFDLFSVTPPLFALSAGIGIKEITGPVVDGTMRGISWVEMGFVQNATFVRRILGFRVMPRPVQLTLVTPSGCNLTGKSVLDIAEGPRPWYRAPLSPVGPMRGVRQWMPDTPFDRDIPLFYPGTSEDADYVEILNRFDLYYAVRTLDDGDGVNADEVYTQRATVDWSYDGQGRIQSVGGAYSFFPSGKGNTSSRGNFREIRDGREVPITTGLTANDYVNGALPCP
ncbi:MAG: Ig-like domain-containing protein, partial [Gemmatimonadota bacterium]|nr:Ig-like domain-containing protein [Gemmatimonadota bacterium]